MNLSKGIPITTLIISVVTALVVGGGIFVFSSSAQGALPPPSAIFSFDVDKDVVGNSIWELTLFNLNEFEDKKAASSEFNRLMEKYIKLKKECGETSDYLEKVGEIEYNIGNNYIKQSVVDSLEENEKYFVLSSIYGGGESKFLYRLKDEKYSQCLSQVFDKRTIDVIIYPTEVDLSGYRTIQQYEDGPKISFNRLYGNDPTAYAKNENTQGSHDNYDEPLLYPVNFRSFYTHYFDKNSFIKETDKTSYELKRYIGDFVSINCNMAGDKYNNLESSSRRFNHYRYTCNLEVDKENFDDLGPFIAVLDKLDSEDVYYSDITNVPFNEVDDIVWGPHPKPNDNKLTISNLETKEPNELIIQFEGEGKDNGIINFIKDYYYLFILLIILLALIVFLIIRQRRKILEDR